MAILVTLQAFEPLIRDNWQRNGKNGGSGIRAASCDGDLSDVFILGAGGRTMARRKVWEGKYVSSCSSRIAPAVDEDSRRAYDRVASSSTALEFS